MTRASLTYATGGARRTAAQGYDAPDQARELLAEACEALASLVFADMGEDEDEGVAYDTQEVWETIFRDRVKDWFSFDDLDRGRKAHAAIDAYLKGSA